VKTILNKTPLPMRIQLGGGKTLHLGPAKTGQIADAAAERASIQKLVKEGKIEILGEGGSSQAQSGEGQQPATSTHGHPQPTVVTPKGNR
jgi:hypothetical protein